MHFFFPKRREKAGIGWRENSWQSKNLSLRETRPQQKQKLHLSDQKAARQHDLSVFINGNKCRPAVAVSPSMAEKSVFMPHTNSMVDATKIKCTLSLIVERISTINSQCAHTLKAAAKLLIRPLPSQILTPCPHFFLFKHVVCCNTCADKPHFLSTKAQ